MGLDMSAARRLYVKQWNDQSPEERYTVQITRGGKLVPGIQSERIAAVEEDVMHWWKANHIHGWFVDNVQYGVDDRKSYYVDWSKLRKLLSVCKEVIKKSELADGTVLQGWYWKPGMTKAEAKRTPGKVIRNSSTAKRLLPTRYGVFFGSEEYDEDYYGDVVKTRDWAERMLADHDAGVPGEIYYSSSW